ncbi:MAG TPA: hypothetical protein VGN01_11280 [Acidobacteriaceae bacterium]
MSRSVRKPYCAVTGTISAKKAKRRAARSVRRAHKQWLHTLEDPESALAPHRLECPGNNVWCWDRDGKQRFHARSPEAWYRKLLRK